MKYSTAISIIVASMLACASMSSFAAGQGQGQRGAANRTHQVDRDRTYDRDRMGDRMRTQDPAHKRDQDRDQDRTHMPDPADMADQDIYGNQLMTNGERKQYREELGNSNTQESRMAYQAQHESKMQRRAMQQGQDLVPPGQGPIYGGEFMSVQERNQYREQMRLSDSDAERTQLQAQHREQMQERARALNLNIEEAE